jgi:tetratricopeptide (TPR) repeat protein
VRALPRLLFLVGAGLTLAAAASAGEQWITARSPHFEMYSCASEDDSRELLNKLEQFRAAVLAICSVPRFHDAKATIVLFATDRQFKSCKPWRDGKPATESAFCIDNAVETTIAAAADNDPEQIDATLFREYMHLLLAAGGGEPPVWLDDGLAELFSTFKIEGDSFILGAGRPAPTETLNRLQLMPLGRLFAMTRESPGYREETFRVESWALLHFLICGKESAIYMPRFRRFNELIATSDGPVDHLFHEAFGMNDEEMGRAIERHLQNSQLYAQRGKLIMGGLLARIEFQPASDFEQEVALGNLRWQLQAPGNAADRLAQLSEAHPTDPRPHEILAEIAMKNGDRAGALDHWQRAAEFGSDNPDVYVRVADERLDRFMIGLTLDTRMQPELTDTLRRWLDRAIALSPRDLDADEALAMVEAFAEQPRWDVIDRFQAALPRMRDKTRLMFAIAILRWRMGDDSAARANVKSLLAAPKTPARLRFLAQRLNWRLSTPDAPATPAAR